MTALDFYGRRATHYIRPVLRAQATGLVASVYAQAEREFVLAPPLTVYSPAPELLAAVWAALRETLIAGPDRLRKEAIALEVSSLNQCPVCLDTHSIMLAAGERVTLPAKPYAAGQMAAFAGTALVFHFINRMVNVFMGDNSPLPTASWLLTPASAIAARTFGRKMIQVQAVPGESLALLPKVNTSSGIGWLDSHPYIGPAFAAVFSVARDGAVPFLSQSVRESLEQALHKWRGEPATLNRSWLSESIAQVPPAELPAARLALLTARASNQVSDADVAAFRQMHSSDEALVRITSYGAAAATQRIATWIATA